MDKNGMSFIPFPAYIELWIWWHLDVWERCYWYTYHYRLLTIRVHFLHSCHRRRYKPQQALPQLLRLHSKCHTEQIIQIIVVFIFWIQSGKTYFTESLKPFIMTMIWGNNSNPYHMYCVRYSLCSCTLQYNVLQCKLFCNTIMQK